MKKAKNKAIPKIQDLDCINK